MQLHRRLAAAALSVLLLAAVNVGPTHAATSTARDLLLRMDVSGEAGADTYARGEFRHWVDANGDCQNTRAEVLVAESRTSVRYTSASRCVVATGRWYSDYDGVTWTSPADVDIDHMVPLKEAWESGARTWSTQQRTRYANDQGSASNLVAVTDNVNQSKGEKDPADWLPPRRAAWCAYAIDWVKVKYRWRLALDSDERAQLESVLSGSCGARTVTVPSRAL